MKSSRHTKKLVYVICDNIRSLYNVGAIFRTSDGAGIVKKIFLTGITGYPKQNDSTWHQTPRIAKTSLGAEKEITWQYVKDPFVIIKKLKKQGITIYALENNIPNIKSKNFCQIKYKFPLALIVGHEINGINKKYLSMIDHMIEIPMHGKKESLNVAVAFGIAIYEIVRQILQL